MESNTISKSKSKINVKLIAITAMCAALVTVTTALLKFRQCSDIHTPVTQ